MNRPAVVAVAGSCPTRDNFNSRFNPDYRRFFTCELSTNQTSMIALMSPPVETPDLPDTVSAYDRWNIHSDFSREFLGELVELQPDYLILDFFADVHFAVLRLPDGRYVTDNRWKIRTTDWYAERKAAGVFKRTKLQRKPEKYLALWTDAMDRFAAFVAEHCPDTVVVVHRGYNTNLVDVPGEPEPVPMRQYKPILDPLNVPLSNELWARLDDHALKNEGWEEIDLRDERCTSAADHPWGPFYVHYTRDYYHRFLAELHKIHLRRTGLDDDLAARLAEIESAATEAGARREDRARRHAAGLEEQAAGLRARVTELESLGPARALRFAVGQQVRRLRARRHDEGDR